METIKHFLFSSTSLKEDNLEIKAFKTKYRLIYRWCFLCYFGVTDKSLREVTRAWHCDDIYYVCTCSLLYEEKLNSYCNTDTKEIQWIGKITVNGYLHVTNYASNQN